MSNSTHHSKSKAKGISSSSFFDLKAEVSKQEEEFRRNKAAGGSTAIVGRVVKPDKKPTKWGKQNKGVKERAERDMQLEAISIPTLESARAILARKAQVYDKLKKGKSGGLSEAQMDGILVDFDSKGIDSRWESDSDDVDESLTVPKPPQDEEEMVEYHDEFGRSRIVPKSEVPREFLPQEGMDNEEDEDLVIHNPVNHFPVYVPSDERTAQIAKEYAEENNPLNVHYDPAKEVRARGAASYAFSADEETRRAQMEELKSARQETERARAEAGALDVKPGEVEGMVEEKPAQSKAMEKRKRELEERREMLAAKRKKTKPTEDVSQAKKNDTEEQITGVFVASAGDPFAALEAASKDGGRPAKEKGRASVANEADAFLAQLEPMLKRKGK